MQISGQARNPQRIPKIASVLDLRFNLFTDPETANPIGHKQIARKIGPGDGDPRRGRRKYDEDRQKKERILDNSWRKHKYDHPRTISTWNSQQTAITKRAHRSRSRHVQRLGTRNPPHYRQKKPCEVKIDPHASSDSLKGANCVQRFLLIRLIRVVRPMITTVSHLASSALTG
jgi:hypothetical protein